MAGFGTRSAELSGSAIIVLFNYRKKFIHRI